MNSQPKHTFLNNSARFIACFKRVDPPDNEANYFEYSLSRFPELRELFVAACTDLLQSPQRVYDPAGKTASALARLEPMLLEQLEFYGIIDRSGAINLNSNVELILAAVLRFERMPSRREMLPLSEQALALKWVLETTPACEALQHMPLEPEALDYLAKHGLLVSAQAPSTAFFPPADLSALSANGASARNGDDTISTEEVLACADQVYLQQPGQLPPKQVLAMLGKFAPELRDTGIAWGRDAGTRMLVAAPATEAELQALAQQAGDRSTLPSVVARKKEWQHKLAQAKVLYKQKSYAKLETVISLPMQRLLRAHIREITRKNYFGQLGDGQVDKRVSIHNEPVAASLHHRLATLVSNLVGVKVVPSYCYLSTYIEGAELKRHIDRSQCRFNMSIVLDMRDLAGNDVAPWPIFLQVKNRTVQVDLGVGDGVVYRGNKLEHWREALPAGHLATVCFYHFVDEHHKGTMV